MALKSSAALCGSPLPIPSEVTEHTLSFCHPCDVAAFSKTCRLAYALVYRTPDQFLWRQLYLTYPFDDPRKALRLLNSAPQMLFDWKTALQDKINAEKIAFGAKRILERTEALQVFVRTVLDAYPVTAGIHEPSGNLGWVAKVLQSSKMLETPAERSELQLRSQLRSYLALSQDECRDEATRTRLNTLRTKSRCLVYDLRNYTAKTRWGAYLPDGNVNWVHVEATINVISMNLSELPGVWVDTRPPTGLEATRAYSAPSLSSRDPRDWAGVTGMWRRYVCFMDYRDLYAFNHTINEDGTSRDASFFEDENFQEATRLIELRLSIVTAEDLPASFRRLFPQPADDDTVLRAEYPSIYFSGTSQGVNGNEATVTGCIDMGVDGVVRWRFNRKASIYDGHTQWSSEGIQVGNVGSAAGVVGTWTGAHHEQGDPVGPFWLWKVADDHPSHMTDYVYD